MTRVRNLTVIVAVFALSACSLPTQPGQSHISSAEPLETPTSRSLTPTWREVDFLPLEVRVEQAIIVGEVTYFSNFGKTSDGLPGSKSVVGALNLNSGEILWQKEYKPLIPMTTDGSHLFVYTESNEIVAISMNDGALLWNISVDSQSLPFELLVGGDQLFYVSVDFSKTSLLAIDGRTGALDWLVSIDGRADMYKPTATSPFSSDRYRNLSYHDGMLYLRMSNVNWMLVAISAIDGSQLWDFPYDVRQTHGDSPPGTASHLAFGDKAVYFGVFGGFSYALDKSTGKMLWKTTGQISSPLYIDQQVIGLWDYQTIASLDANSGEVEWTTRLSDYIDITSPFVIFDKEYLVAYSWKPQENSFTLIDTASGVVISTWQFLLPTNCIPSSVTLVVQELRLYLVTPNCLGKFESPPR
jgi:outer membrane protein assembly factor BamB